MVRGFGLFKAHFAHFTDYFVVIGGAAASEWFSKEGFTFRATRDIDIVLLMEVMDRTFARRFWEFVNLGGYAVKQRGEDDRRYYRFARPGNPDYPHSLELFSRGPEGMALSDGQNIVPIRVGEGASSLSAILMDDDYYGMLRDSREVCEGVPLIAPPRHHLAQGESVARPHRTCS